MLKNLQTSICSKMPLCSKAAKKKIKSNLKCLHFLFFKYSIFSFDPSSWKTKGFEHTPSSTDCYLLPYHTSRCYLALGVCWGCSAEGNDSAACSGPNHGPCLPGQSHPKEQRWRAAAEMKIQRICRAAGSKCAKTLTSFIKEKHRKVICASNASTVNNLINFTSASICMYRYTCICLYMTSKSGKKILPF